VPRGVGAGDFDYDFIADASYAGSASFGVIISLSTRGQAENPRLAQPIPS